MAIRYSDASNHEACVDRWHTDSDKSTWLPSHGYNTLFYRELDKVRQHFGLQNSRFGLDQGTNLWLPYQLRSESIFINVISLDWSGHSCSGRKIQFDLRLKIAEEASSTLIDQLAIQGMSREQELLYLQELVTFAAWIDFPPGFPSEKPALYFDEKETAKLGYGNLEGFGCYLLNGNKICTMNQQQDWTPRHSIVDAILYLFHWMSANLDHVKRV